MNEGFAYLGAYSLCNFTFHDYVGIYIWRGRPTALRCHYGRCCKGFWGSSGTFVFIELSQSQNSDISLNLLVFHSGKKEISINPATSGTCKMVFIGRSLRCPNLCQLFSCPQSL